MQDFGEFMKSNRLAPWPRKKGQANTNILEKSKSMLYSLSAAREYSI